MPGVGLLLDVRSLAGPSTQIPSSPLSSSDGRLVRPLTGFLNPASEVAFLRAAVERIAALGGDPKASVVAVEVDPAVHRAIRESFGREVASGALFEADFFTLDTSRIGLFNCAVGNPPFIRYQRFNGEQLYGCDHGLLFNEQEETACPAFGAARLR